MSFLWWLAALLAQAGVAPEPQLSPPTLRITVTLVQVDVVVTDSRGRRVTGLRPEDFVLLQDGKPQRITHFSYVPEAPPGPRFDRRMLTPPAGPPAPLPPGQVKRTVAIVVDDLALSFENLARTRESLKKSVEQGLQPGDLIAIVRTGGGISMLEQFTTDRRLLLAAVDQLKWRFPGRCGTIPPQVRHPEAEDRPAAAREPEVLDYGCTLSALGTLKSLEQVVAGMRDLPGRKSVVLLSDRDGLNYDVQAQIDRLTDLANRSAVSLYAVDVSGLKVRMPDPMLPAEAAGPGREDRQQPLEEELQDVFGENRFPQGDGLGLLAGRTGGLFFGHRNDIAQCVRLALDDQFGYYLIGYAPQEGTFEKSGKEQFHRVSVKVRRPRVSVRWKSGFNGVPDELVATELAEARSKRTREQQLMDALSSPFHATGMRVRLTTLFLHGEATGPRVRTLLHFDARDFTFRPLAGGNWGTFLDLVTTSFRDQKLGGDQRERVQSVVLPEAEYRKALREGFLFMMDHPTKEPGPFLLRAVVRDSETQRIGSASQFVEVPDTRKGRLAMTSLVLNLAPDDVLRKLNLPVAADVKDGATEAWAEGGPAVRRYRPGQSLLYSYIAINPKLKGAGAQKKFNLVSQVRVFRNGKLLWEGEPVQLAEEGKRDDTHVVGGGLIRLGARLTPGEYLVQVQLKDKNAGRKHSQTAQWSDFEVVAEPPKANPETMASRPGS